MTPPRPNEGIDLEKEATELAKFLMGGSWFTTGIEPIKALMARVREEERTRLSQPADIEKEVYMIVYKTVDPEMAMEKIINLCARCRAETERALIEELRTWKPTSAIGCALCVYDDGVFKSLCSFHSIIVETQRKCVNEHADVKRVIEWANDPDRKPANTAFTEGPERQMAYLIEEIEAVVREKVILMARDEVRKELPKDYTHEQWCLKNLGGCFEKKAAYESNDAGGSR